MHSAEIYQIRATADSLRLLSVSQDKTVRVWRTRDLRLLRTIRVPSDSGEEGALRTLAITPDGREVFVGGWTGMTWSGKGQLYRFELATGKLLQTLRGFPANIEAISISPDGRRLAVGLGGDAGLRVLQLPGGQEVLADTAYRQRVTAVDFAADGSLATTAQDGCLRLYAPEGPLVLRAEFPPPADPRAAVCTGGEIGSVRFSPDGRSLAFGRQDRAEVVVLDVASRAVRRIFKVSDAQQRSLCCVSWARDGQRLYMNGLHARAVATPLYAADLATGATTVLEVGRQRFTSTLALPGGDLLFSTSAPSLARVTAQGRLVAEALPPNGDFRFDWNRFRVSPDGQRISLPMRADGRDERSFDTTARPDKAYRAATPADAGQLPPQRGGGLVVEATLGDYGYRDPVRVAGHPVRLKDYQSVHSWAAAADGRGVALGTQWSVVYADAQGKVLWEKDLAAVVHQVNVSRDGRWIVAALSDGTLRWFDIDGTERFGLFLEAAGSDWVAWRPDGYYTSSPHGDKFMGWLLNRGDTAEPAFFRAVQFERQLYRPDLAATALTASAPMRSDARETLRAVLESAAVPRVTIASVVATQHRTLLVDVRVAANGRPVREVGVYVDGLPALRAAERVAEGASPGATLSRVYEIPMLSPGASVRVEAETDVSIGMDETLPVEPVAFDRHPPGRLWALTIGISKFDLLARDTELRGTLNDATALARELQTLAGRQFTAVDVQTLTEATSEKPTKAAILGRFQALERAVQPEDTVVIFIASHGLADGGEYYLITKDASPADVERVLDASERRMRLAGHAVPSVISGSELATSLRRIPGRRLLVLDTCHAGQARNDADPYALVKRSAAAQLAVMSAASGDELSAESGELGHGVFTYMLMRALRGEIGPRRGAVTVQQMFDALRPEVDAELRRMKGNPRLSVELRRTLGQTPTLMAINPLRASVLTLRE